MSSQRLTARLAPALIGLILVNVVIEAVLFGADLGLWGAPLWRGAAYAAGAFWTPLLQGAKPLYPGQPVTMFASYAVLHGGWLHLAVNMIALFSFGTVIIQRIGQRRFLLAYASAAGGGAIAFALLSRSALPMVGASGALFGLLGIWVCWDYLERRHRGGPIWTTARALVFLVIYNLVFWLLLRGNLAWETHLGGFVAGWLLALHWGRKVLVQSRLREYGHRGRIRKD